MKNKLIVILLIIFGFSLFTVTSFVFLISNSIKQTLEHNREFEKSFQEVSLKVDTFVKIKKRFPTADEFNAINEFMTLNSSADQYPKQWEAPPVGAYYLARWTGDNDEFYASWNRKTTLIFDEDSYYFFHSKLLSSLLAGVLAILGAIIFISGLRLLKSNQKSL